MADPQTLAQRLKAKYPEYADIPDAELEQRVLAKYPEYGDMPRTQAVSTPEKPGLFSRASEQFGLTQNPGSQLVSELRQFKDAPLSTLWQTVKAPIIGARDLAYNLATRPIETVKQATGGNQFAEDVQNKNYTGAAGTLLGAAGQVALMKGSGASLPVPKAAQGLGERLYQSALKPSPAGYNAAQVKSLVGTGLDNGIPVSKAGAERLATLADDLSTKVKAQIAAGDRAGASVNKFSVTRRLGDTAKTFENQVAPTADLNTIGEVGNDFLATKPPAIPVQMAQDIKTGTYRQLRNKYGELGAARVEAEKSLARGIKEELETQFPEIKGMNAQESRLIGLDEALQRAVRRIDNHQIIGLGTPAVAGAVGIATGSGVGAAAGAALKIMLDNPEVKSRLAITLNRASNGRLGISGASMKVAGYSAALSRALTATPPDPQASAQTQQ